MKKKKGKTPPTDDDVKKDDEQQSLKFIQTALEHDNKSAGKRFEKALRSVVNSEPKK